MKQRIGIGLAMLLLISTGCAGWHPPAPAPVPADMEISSGWQLQDVTKIPQGGETVSRAIYAPSHWHAAVVPGTVLTSLVADRVYPEPLYGENNRPDKIPEKLSRTSYWYRTQFVVPIPYEGRQVWLNFDGINYIADVWLNGNHLGEVKGAFARGNFDVTKFVYPGESATLAVRILPPPHPGDPLEQTVRNGTGRNGGILSEDGPTFLCTLGWDWIPGIRDRDMGIWQRVFLSATGPVVIENPLVASDLPLPKIDEADLSIEATVRNVSNVQQKGVLHGTIESIDFKVPLSLQPNESHLVKLTPATTSQLHLRNPRLWWPNGYGPQNLYRLHLSFEVNGNAPSDARDINFGIRKITYSVPNSDNLTVSVNGVPIMCRGGNWGMDEALKRIPRERLEACVRLHQLANLTMIRNWVGQSTSEDLYDMCDKYGILVWDEFFQPNPSDGPNPVDTDMFLANVREKVLRFRNHPSIAIWCGRNEGKPPPAIDEGIQKIMAELEPMRLYHSSSTEGHGVRSGGPYSWQVPRNYYTAFRGFPLEPFKTEIGPVSIPTIEAIHAMMPQKDWEIVNDDWAEHDLCRGAQQGRFSQPYAIVMSQRYGKLANLADFVRKAQLANYEAHRALYEGRNSKMFNPCTAVLLWMSNPSQPSFVWQIYSHDLEPNASLFGAKKGCEMIHIQMNQNDFHAMVINNTPVALDGYSASVRIFNLDGSLQQEKKIVVNAKASAANDLGEIIFPKELSPVHFVKLELHDAKGQLISENFYWRAPNEHVDDLTALETLPTTPLDVTIARHDANGNCLLDVTLANHTSSVALMAHLQLRKQDSSARVLPVYYSDNYVSLLPGESRTISIEAASNDLGKENPLVVLDGWNVTTESKTFPSSSGDASVSLNGDAQVENYPKNGLTVIPSPIPIFSPSTAPTTTAPTSTTSPSH
jgi:hypothetical protein